MILVQTIFDSTLLAIAFAVIAYVYAVILTEPGMILSGWYKFLRTRIGTTCFFKPLIDCDRCVSGQIALWSYPMLFWDRYAEPMAIIRECPVYSIMGYVYCIAFTILFVHVIQKIHRWTKT